MIVANTEVGAASASEADPPPADGRPATRARVLDSAALLQGARSVLINHDGEFYRLQATRQGKLILTK